ncbi:MAG: DEAD/DEAH box helicase, partial [Gemmatimonadaceae bacterium]
PVEREWAELIVNGEDALMPYLAVMASVESLHRMTRDERDLSGLVVSGSDHLTAYNVYAEAFATAGYIGQVYGLPRHLFDEETIARWADRRGVLVKAIEDTALAMASVYRGVDLPLPTEMPLVKEGVRRAFCDLLARIMPFDLVIDEATAAGDEARVSKSSVCGSWGAVAGTLRYFADRFGVPRAAIEGTQVPMGLIRQYAVRGTSELVYAGGGKREALVLESRLTYFGFELDRDEELLDDFPSELKERARRVLAEALARGETRHAAVKRNHRAIEDVRELYRRSAAKTPRLGQADLASLYEREMERDDVLSMREFRAAPLRLDLSTWVPDDMRETLAALPEYVEVRDKAVGIEYDVEEGNASAPLGVARLVLPEKMARTLVDEELPQLDRPLRFVVQRGQRGNVRGDSLGELQERLDLPWTPREGEESARRDRGERSERGGRGGGGGGGRDGRRRQRDTARGNSERGSGARRSSQGTRGGSDSRSGSGGKSRGERGRGGGGRRAT